MGHRPHDAEEIELSCRIGDLRVSICGPPDQATKLLQEITSKARQSSPSARSEGSFSVVSSCPAPSSQRRPRPETRDQIQASFSACPVYLVNQGARLSGSTTSGPDRVRRAWLAGQWAKATVEGRTPSPNRSPQLDLRSRYYAVVQASGLERPAIFKSAKSYWDAVGDLATSNSVSHAFPSEQEARIYFAGAEIVDFDLLQ